MADRLATAARGVRDGDEAKVVRAVEELSRRHRLLAPLALAVGGVAMRFGGLRLLLSNWRLTVIQIPPAMWIWAAMYDLRGHLLHPAYVLGRIGLLMIGSPFLRFPGILLFLIGFTLQAGATSAVKAVKMGAMLGRRDAAGAAGGAPPP